eukprot:NODE_414_length_1525_cov_103.089413_g382_i0.p1 GENE.NODE_414_length_1525_cov_103.089413_g382_i0~~NODE_414_length_1525_cov_103.089413_g382_i0.p1  ORF type:complete len:329 (+),score=45.54 NODE_414_length_1525_cov_103.089413_g382_i0:103-987(+)
MTEHVLMGDATQAGDRARRHESSWRFSQDSLLDFEHKLTDGFYDCGRSVGLPSLDSLKAQEAHSGREVIYVDRNTDTAFAELVEKAGATISVGNEIKARAVLLSLAVSNYFGGTNDCLISNTEKGILQLKSRRNSNVLPIGQLQYGVCRHRAVAYKYICDREGIPCRLVRGDYMSEKGTEGHSWNVVRDENGRLFIVDIMHDPGNLYEECSAKAKHYKRVEKRGGELKYAGGPGMGSIASEACLRAWFNDNVEDPDKQDMLAMVKMLREECAIKDLQIDSLAKQVLDADPMLYC